MLITPKQYEDFVLSLFARNQGDLSKDVAHAVMGIITELVELENATDNTNLIDEVGDLLFFSVALDSRLREHLAASGLTDVSLPASTFVNITDGTLMVVLGTALTVLGGQAVDRDSAIATALPDMAKKWVGYGAEPDLQVVQVCLAVTSVTLSGAAQRAAVRTKRTVGEVLQRAAAANMRKLRTRYKQGFSVQDAEHRDRAAERDALRGDEGSAMS